MAVITAKRRHREGDKKREEVTVAALLMLLLVVVLPDPDLLLLLICSKQAKTNSHSIRGNRHIHGTQGSGLRAYKNTCSRATLEAI